MPMRKKILEPLSDTEIDAIRFAWKRNDQDAYKWIGRLIREIDALRRQNRELRDIYFATQGVDIEKVTVEEARRLFDQATAKQRLRLESVR